MDAGRIGCAEESPLDQPHFETQQKSMNARQREDLLICMSNLCLLMDYTATTRKRIKSIAEDVALIEMATTSPLAKVLGMVVRAWQMDTAQTEATGKLVMKHLGKIVKKEGKNYEQISKSKRPRKRD
jgi:hypothetical protein